MNLKDAEIILMKNLRGQRNKADDILTVAKAASVVRKSYSNGEIKDMFGITMTSFGRINSINRLNPKGRSMVKRGVLKIEQAYHLSRMDPGRQDQAAKTIASMNTSDTRLFVSLALEHPDRPVELLERDFARGRHGNISVVVTPMPDAMYNKLLRMAESQNKEPHDLIIELVGDYLGR